MKQLFLVVVAVLSSIGCGRYLPPIAPERMAAKEIRALEVKADEEGLHFTWKVPLTDRRGEELKYLSGFQIFKIPEEDMTWFLVGEDAEATDLTDEKYEIAFVKDTHLELLKERREQARKEGKLVRRVALTEEEMTLTWSDTELEEGKRFLYQIVPENSDSVRGNSSQLVRVTYKKADSQIQMLKQGSENAR